MDINIGSYSLKWLFTDQAQSYETFYLFKCLSHPSSSHYIIFKVLTRKKKNTFPEETLFMYLIFLFGQYSYSILFIKKKKKSWNFDIDRCVCKGKAAELLISMHIEKYF